MNDLDPVFRRKIEQLIQICDSQGLHFRITDGYRSPKDQDALYSQGRTKPGKVVTNARGTPVPQSLHCFGLAIDFIPLVKGKYVYDLPTMRKIAEVAESIGLEWGGRWKGFPDNPHIQYTQGKPLSFFQNGGRIVEEPVMNISPSARLKALTNRLSRTTSDSTKRLISAVIERLKMRM